MIHDSLVCRIACNHLKKSTEKEYEINRKKLHHYRNVNTGIERICQYS